MKRLLAIIFIFLTLCGCNSKVSEIDDALSIRQQLLKAQGCRFIADISADYQDGLYHFTLACETDENGLLQFTVISPEAISGITGNISSQGGKLTFDDKVLAFPLLADGLMSPVSGPWILMQALRSGYIKSSGADGDGVVISINDTYSGESLRTDIYLDNESHIKHADIFWQGKRILSIAIKDFVYL